MATTVRRPLPALIALLALLLLTGIVWWRVASRDDTTANASTCSPSPSPSRSATLPAPASITVQVLNSTQTSGLAAKVRGVLQQRGFQVTAPGNAKPAVSGAAQIRFGPSGRKAATLVHYYFPGAAMTTTASTTAIVQVVVGKAYKSVATQPQVSTALKGDKVAVTSPAPPPVPGSDC